MNIITAILLGLAMGALFGIALEKSRVFEPGAIVGQMQLRSFLMLKIFLTAVATGLVVLAVLNGMFGVKMHPKALIWSADVIGGLLLGAGIAIAGACPGTVFAQLGVGYRDAWFTFAGGVLGALVFGYLEPTLNKVLLSGGPGKLTVHQGTGTTFWIDALILATGLVVFLFGLERYQSWRTEQGRALDGLMEPKAASRDAPAGGAAVAR